MISVTDRVFRIDTKNSTYIFRLTKFMQPEHLYYGRRLPGVVDIDALRTKTEAGFGTSVAYDPSEPSYSLDHITLEYSGIGRGDYRMSPLEIKMPDGTFITDFVYDSHEITDGSVAVNGMPGGRGGDKTLAVRLKDVKFDIYLTLFYTVFYDRDVITRRVRIETGGRVVIRKAMSYLVDFPGTDFTLYTLTGGWIKEAHLKQNRLVSGTYVHESTAGLSGNRANPAFIIARTGASEDYGDCYGFNLLYSGNHYSAVQVSEAGLLRVMSGINPHCFEWELENGAFDTPEAILSYSCGGLNGLSKNMHDFINNHIIPSMYRGSARPVLYNSWESISFDVSERKIMRQARLAKKLGIELLVLDDGWFTGRNDDKGGLGDWVVDRKKLRGGLRRLAQRIGRLGMRFGLWFEPEMVNRGSRLYAGHPDWIVSVPGRAPCESRNQFVLDLCNTEVTDYIIARVSDILSNADISYVKWDCNRNISDMFSEGLANQGEFFHRYILGLYRVLDALTARFPGVLFESCASGGNRFDAGMLYYFPQAWASDDTDPIERLKIQGGLSMLYPLSAIGAHVADVPSMQVLRNAPLCTRFNVAAFGVLGYEMDLYSLTPAERREVCAQIKMYKQYRTVFQYGSFYRIPVANNRLAWMCVSEDKRTAVAGFFQTLAEAAPKYDVLRLKGLDENLTYEMMTVPSSLPLNVFGYLIKHALPVKLRHDGFIMRTVSKFFMLKNSVERYTAGGGMFMSAGVRLSQQFSGTGYTKDIRLLKDFGSQIYILNAVPGSAAE